jgi:A/G-specific adenine glycosylase
MLQQTQVATVIPYYHGFMKAFPNLEALDRAPLAEVLAHWSGLGYYRRAENLKKSARIVARRYFGRLPADYESLRALPGIGEYTAGALLSIAFGKPYPAIDGNARRVLARIFLETGEKKLRDLARQLVSTPKAGQFNQSLMELGSVLCTPKNPSCAKCPVETLCLARKSRDGIPRGPAKKNVAPREVVWPLAIVRRNGKLLLRRRASRGILAGLWELPGGEQRSGAKPPSLFERHFPRPHQIMLQSLRLGEVSHSITNRRIRAPVYLIELAPADQIRLDGARWRWVSPRALHSQPTSAMTRKAVKLLSDHEKDNS